MQIEVPSRFAGPPGMGHGGYVAGLLADRAAGGAGAVQVTLRRPIPLDRSLEVHEAGDHRLELRDGDHVVVESERTTLEIEVPPAPTFAEAAAAEAGSPSHHKPHGVHPTCFGCGSRRAIGDGLRIFVGPVEVGGATQVAGSWRPGVGFADADGLVPTHWVLAALDCPGAFAFIVDGKRAGLLGRILFEQYADVRADDDLVVSGWQIGEEGRKLFAGTALTGSGGRLLAAARATWFAMPSTP